MSLRGNEKGKSMPQHRLIYIYFFVSVFLMSFGASRFHLFAAIHTSYSNIPSTLLGLLLVSVFLCVCQTVMQASLCRCLLDLKWMTTTVRQHSGKMWDKANQKLADFKKDLWWDRGEWSRKIDRREGSSAKWKSLAQQQHRVEMNFDLQYPVCD